ncbi:MAG TPA: hypothetical protein VHC39_17525 [Rhizomicrobium sp.]|nr:hypothetical protein [Rhizomicrobium sp.]
MQQQGNHPPDAGELGQKLENQVGMPQQWIALQQQGNHPPDAGELGQTLDQS